MRLSNFVMDTTSATVASGSSTFSADGVDPSTRQIKDDIYPLDGELKLPFHAFQGASRVYDGNDSTHINMMLTGSKNAQNLINNNSTMKMTGSLSAIPEPGSQYKWDIIMVADSVFKG